MLTTLFKALTFAHTPKAISLLSDIFDYIKETFFTIEYGDYENIQVSSGGLGSIQTVIFGLAVGIVIAACSLTFTKRVLGDFVRDIIGRDCFDPKSALTLSELGYERNTAIRSALRSNYVLKKYVRIVTEEEQKALDAPEAEASKADSSADEAAKQSADQSVEATVKDTEQTESQDAVGQAPNNEQEQNEITKKPGVLLRDAGKIDLSSARFFIDKDASYGAEVRFDKKGTNPLALVLVIVVTFLLMVAVFKLLPDLLQMLDNFLGSTSDTSNDGFIPFPW